MFGFFRNKKRQPQTPPTAYRNAPGTHISYSPELVDNLKSDHQALLSLYIEIKSDLDARRYPKIVEKLAEFRTALTSHLLTENVRLYVYLDRQFSRDETNSELIRSFRKEMDNIGRIAMNFLRKYEELGVDADLVKHFSKDFATIGEVLTNRIQREEETLYPLYVEDY
jgi:hemerythrin-like domain-containing protein